MASRIERNRVFAVRADRVRDWFGTTRPKLCSQPRWLADDVAIVMVRGRATLGFIARIRAGIASAIRPAGVRPLCAVPCGPRGTRVHLAQNTASDGRCRAVLAAGGDRTGHRVRTLPWTGRTPRRQTWRRFSNHRNRQTADRSSDRQAFRRFDLQSRAAAFGPGGRRLQPVSLERRDAGVAVWSDARRLSSWRSAGGHLDHAGG